MRYNPSISEAPRHQDTPVVRRATGETILAWLERKGRLIPDETDNDGKRTYSPISPAEQHSKSL